MRNWSAGVLLALLALTFGGACGDDDAGDGEGDGAGSGNPSREHCVQPGFTATDCTCVAGGPMGSRHCDDDMTWSACTCPEAHDDRTGCDFDGQRVLCDLCPGESERRMTECMDSHFDCSCSRDAGARDGGSAGRSFMESRAALRIGVDLGGTKTELVALDGAGAERFRKRVATPAHEYAAVVAAIAELVREAEQALGAHATVGVGTPGALSRATGLLRNANTVCLNGKPLDADLSRALAREVRIANDANCFALSEAHDGAGRGAAVVFGVILGTGTGGGVVVSGRLVEGRNAIAGEWGHNPLPWPAADELPGPACYCGKRGCVETFLSGPGLSADYARAGGPTLPATEVAARAAQGEAAARAALARHLDRLARSLAVVIDILDPDVIVLGGGLSQIASLYAELPQRLPAYVFSDRVDTRVVPALHGDSGGARGAAWLWPANPQ